MFVVISPLTFAADEKAAHEREMAALGETPPLRTLPLSEAPGATTVITAEEIARSGAANIFDVLRRVPGVDIRYTPMGGHIGIRSAGPSPFSEEVLLLIDGTPYNSPDKGGFPGHPNYRGFFPLERIERIEVVKGPISVVYGANAFGGVVNIVSKKPSDMMAGRVDGFTAGASLLGGERETWERSLRAAFIRNGWGASLHVDGLDGYTPVHLNEEADNTRVNAQAVLQRGRFNMSVMHQENSNGSFSFLGDPTRTARHKVDILDTHYARPVGGFTLTAAASVNRYSGTTCAVCHNNQTLEPDNAVTDEVGDERETDQRARVALRADRLLTDAQDLNMGFELMQDSFNRDIVVVDETDDHLTSGGAWLQHQWHFRDRTMHLISGVRYDRAEGFEGAASPRLAFVAQATPGVVLRGSWARAFRAPTWNERYIRQRFRPSEVSPGTIIVAYGNDDMDRERVDSIEAGVSWSPSSLVMVSLDLYRNEVHAFIQRTPAPFAPGSPSEIRVQYTNREDDFTIQGGELTVGFRPTSELSFTTGYAYKDLDIGWDDPHAAYAPRNRATLTATWVPTPSWSFDAAGSYASRYTVSNPNVFGVRPQPAYQLWDAAARWTVPMTQARMTLGLVGRNLFDKNPYESLNNPGIDTSLRGRVIAFELRADF
ncbi:MAG: TonB-dependent receptor plug domain-containing protein [Candidatus Polarisedimenticolia bacterium]